MKKRLVALLLVALCALPVQLLAEDITSEGTLEDGVYVHPLSEIAFTVPEGWHVMVADATTMGLSEGEIATLRKRRVQPHRFLAVDLIEEKGMVLFTHSYVGDPDYYYQSPGIRAYTRGVLSTYLSEEDMDQIEYGDKVKIEIDKKKYDMVSIPDLTIPVLNDQYTVTVLTRFRERSITMMVIFTKTGEEPMDYVALFSGLPE